MRRSSSLTAAVAVETNSGVAVVSLGFSYAYAPETKHTEEEAAAGGEEHYGLLGDDDDGIAAVRREVTEL